MTEAETQLTRARAWVATRLPFFAVLALHLPQQSAAIPTASTDGRVLYYNPVYLSGLRDEETRGLLLHLVMHAALGHVWRRGGRDPARWERACDIVVNGVLRGLIGLALPPGADTVDAALEGRTAEEIYALLPPDVASPESGRMDPNPGGAAPQTELEAYWAEARAAALQTGDAPGALERHYPQVRARLGWTQLLQRHLVRAAHDYAWNVPDRRMLGQDLIYPSLAGEGLRVAVVLDTSGSVSPDLIGAFLAELRALRRAQPNISGLVVYADAKVHAIQPLERVVPPSVTGGGGTSFAVAFAALRQRRFQPDLLIYLTDGEADFPVAPPYPVIWVLPEGSSVQPPWGETVRLKLEI